MERLPVFEVNEELQKIKIRYQEKYGVAFFDAMARIINGIITLEGLVLSDKQKNEVYLAVKDIIKNSKIKNKIKVLSDPKENLEIGWGVVTSEVADVWVKFPDKKNLDEKKQTTCGERSRARLDLTIGAARLDSTSSRGWKRASQALKSDFLRVLARKNKWLLAQTRDLAIGWIDSKYVAMSKWEIIKKEWIKTKRLRQGEVFQKRLAKNTQKRFINFLKKYIKVRYLLGGMADKGIDCSGLTERFYLEIFNLMLPRHSGDQALCGKKIELKAAHFGDLIFLRHKKSKFSHIGIVVEKFENSKSKHQSAGHILILNSRLEKKGVVIEDLSEILKSYNLISVRRIIRGI